MSPRKIYALSMLVGLALALVVIFIVQKSGDSGEASSSSRAASEEWASFASEASAFRARFPGTPETSSAELEVPGTNVTLTQEYVTATDTKGNVYYITTVGYPSPIPSETVIETLRAGLQGMVGGVEGNKLLASESIMFQGEPALSFIIEDPNDLNHRGMLLMRGNLLYQIFVTAYPQDFVETNYDYFIASFEPSGEQG